jgi:clan AA aspartic protease
MGAVYTEITLKNYDDVARANPIRETTVRALVDTGAWTLVINEALRAKLGLRIAETKTGTLADGKTTEYHMAGPVEIYWKNRRALCEAIVLPQADDILLGAIPLETMDLMIHPLKEEVVGVHGDEIIHKVK